MKNLSWAVLMTTLACASGAPASNVKKIVIDEPFQLRVGEEAEYQTDDLFVSFVAVTGDSRCPVGVQCFWEGNAELDIGAMYLDEVIDVALHTNGGRDYPREADVFGWTLRLEALEPVPKAGAEIAPGDYVATLVLRGSE